MTDLDFPVVAASVALFAAALKLGGGLYECLLLDRVWPANPSLIQPHRGGVNRKLFWMPLHFAFEIAVVIALWLAWDDEHARIWLLLAAGSHLVMRAWSFAYFIPRALAFEAADELGPELQAQARRWVRLSIWRLPLDVITLLSTYVATLELVAAAQ